MRKKRIGIICDDILSTKEIYNFIENSLQSKNYIVTTLIIQDLEKRSILKKSLIFIMKNGIKRFLEKFLFTIITYLENKILKIFKIIPLRTFDKFDLSKFNLKRLEVHPIISKSGFIYNYSKNDIDKIKKENLELLVRGGSGILKGAILDICPNGIISFHHGDNYVNRGGPPGFWETYNQDSQTGFVIQRLKDELDGGDILYKGFISTAWLFSLNKARILELSNPCLNYVIEEITSGNSNLKISNKKPYYNLLLKSPNLTVQFFYLINTLRKLSKKIINKLMQKDHRWGVAYQFVENWQDSTFWRSNKIINPPKRFLADPFVIKRDNKYFCFVEDFYYENSKGLISVYEINKNGYIELGVALKENFHLSYPFIFKFENELFMCPETSSNNDIRVYKCIDFPLKWELENILIKNINAVDTNIFQFNNKWWLMTSVSDGAINDFNNTLKIFYSDNPLSNNWTPHKRNPILIDSSRARNGGLITEENSIYRVYQKQDYDMYGKALGVSKIHNIDEGCYREEKLFEIEANFFSNLKGVHTLNFHKGLMVFDYVRITYKFN